MIGHSQNIGAIFESVFESQSISEGIATTRFPLGCKRIGKTKLIQIKTPWDWILSKNKRTALIDTKTTSGKVFRHSMIEPHQLGPLYDHEYHGALAGYVVEYRGSGIVVFHSASNLLNRKSGPGSIHPEEGLLLGPMGGFRVARIFE